MRAVSCHAHAPPLPESMQVLTGVPPLVAWGSRFSGPPKLCVNDAVITASV